MFYRFVLAYICIWFICPRKLWARSKKDELLFVAAGLCGVYAAEHGFKVGGGRKRMIPR